MLRKDIEGFQKLPKTMTLWLVKQASISLLAIKQKLLKSEHSTKITAHMLHSSKLLY